MDVSEQLGIPLSGYVPYLIRYSFCDARDIFYYYESFHDLWVQFATEDGSFYFEIGDRCSTASFGDLVICPPDTRFRRVVVSPVTLLVFQFRWHDDVGGERTAAETSAIPYGKVSMSNTTRLHAAYAAVRKQSNPQDRWNKLRVNHYLHNLWLQYCEETEAITRSNEAVKSQDPLIAKAILLIQQQAFQKTSMDAISAELGISQASLSKRFRSRMGMPPIQYLTDIRLNKAKTLLLETNLTIDEISERCGYKNGFYLSRVFSENCRVSPMQFRKEHRL
jgi:AraC-like DNA-binding protein